MNYCPTRITPIEVDLAQWGAQVASSFFPLEIRAAPGKPFAAWVQVSQMANCRVAQVKANAHCASLSTASARKLSSRYVKVLWQQHGSAQLRQTERVVDIEAGHWAIYEASRPYQIEMRDDSAFVVLLCEVDECDALAKLLPRVAGRSMAIEGGAAVALATLDAMQSQGDRLDPRSHSTVGNFVATLLAQEAQFLENGAGALRRKSLEILFDDAQQYVRRHLERPDLGPSQIALALGVSRRTLYHAFAASGETPQACIQRLRLERCRDDLSRQGGSGASITQLALEIGFSDPAYFARIFRRRYGCTPTEFRTSVRNTA
ncbi:AraC family transcriptional regulator [Candidatus Aalborgicola defluviihabitans]|jgi:AraC-like DNA-binding protein|uniref:AraC family transcriptional regulator n=1 Tax=Candidatus Aalborgicola defluviihabitans TaxID=3386187 RepID=UPI001DCE70A1|nr:AraC family transcriptional regulator [Burkholderiales bacterium]MBK6570299.1 AraC family transcriptional regulator [Burkholderiales bacterium]MBK7279303.1 AraC family transcriptional regulator [Burkholderiales bacterium]MBK7313002.1 AraC family transcriptional regulator [Burkholderiales bacterium]MBL0243813.1 AraC family transcriptional regulator [Rhodoferax sp.]